MERLKREAEERKEMIEQELREYEEREASRLERVEEYVDKQIDEMDHRIKEEDLVKAIDRKSTRLNSSHSQQSRMPSSA